MVLSHFSKYSRARWPNRTVLLLLLSAIGLVITSCSDHRLTYFRKHKASVDDARTQWGLCGGGYYPNGAPKEDDLNDPKIMDCMKVNGYLPLNDYYKETLVTWVRRGSQNARFFSREKLIACGARSFDGGLCPGVPFIIKSEFNRVNECMTKLGYVVTPPRRMSVRIYDSVADVPKGFCNFLSPVSERGGIGLFHWRYDW